MRIQTKCQVEADDKVRYTRCAIHSTIALGVLAVWLFNAYAFAVMLIG